MTTIRQFITQLSIFGWMCIAIPFTPRALSGQDSLPATASVDTRLERAPTGDAMSVLSAIVRIGALRSDGSLIREGSGFVIEHDGLIVTSDRLVRDAAALEVRLRSGERYADVALVASDERRGLALLRIPALGLATLAVDRGNEPALGDEVFVAFPDDDDPLRATGHVAAKPRIDGVALLQLSSADAPSSAGFPVLNREGRVIGIGLPTAAGPEPMSLAVPSSQLATLLESLDAPRPPAVNGTTLRPRAPAAARRTYVPVREPTGSYALSSARDWPTGQRLVGRALIVQEDATYRLLGWARIETDRSWVVTHETFYALNAPITILPGGRIAAQIDRTMEGGFVASDTILLAPVGTPVHLASGRDLVQLVGAGPDASLSTPDGIYKLVGKGGREGASPANITGTVALVRTEAHHVSGRGNGVLLYIQLTNASGTRTAFAATGSITGSGYFVLDPVRWSDGHRTTGTGSITAGQVELTLQETYQWEEKHLDQKVVVRGSKLQP